MKSKEVISTIWHEFILFSGSMLLTWIFSTYVVAHILGPELYGEWTIILLVLMYGQFVHFGILQALSRNIPYAIGENDQCEVSRIQATSFWSLFSVYGIVCIGSATILHFCAASLVQPQKIWLIALLLFLNFVYDYAIRFYTAHSLFKAVGMLNVLVLMGIIVTIWHCVAWSGIVGVLWSFIFARFLALSVTMVRYSFHVNGEWSWATLRVLYQVGIPLFIAESLFLLFTSLERVYIAALLGKLMVSYYGIAYACGTVLVIISESLGKMMYVYIAQSAGEHHLDRAFYQTLVTSVRISSWIFALLMGLLGYAVPFIVTMYLPEYEESIRVAQWYLLGVGMLCVSALPRYYLLAQQKLIPYSGVVCMGVMVKIVVLFFCWISQVSLVFIAASVSFITIITALFFLWIMFRRCYSSIYDVLREMLYVCIPFGVVCMFLLPSYAIF